MYRISFFISLIGVLFLAFLAGTAATYYQLPPYRWIHGADEAYVALKAREHIIKTDERFAATSASIDQPVVHKAGAYEGYTVYTSFLKTQAILIDMDGHIVHRWSLPFYTAWPHPEHVEHPIPESSIEWFSFRLFPNGDALAVYHGRGDTPYGYGLVKMDKDSHVLWRYSERVNHFFDVGTDGTIYALVHRLTPIAGLPDIASEQENGLEDFLVMLSPEGKELKRLSLTRILATSPWRKGLRPVNQQFGDKWHRGHNLGRWDLLHPNSTNVLTPAMAKAFPMFKPGQVLISLRSIDALAVFDPDSGKVVWLVQGPWRQQHDARFLSDGTILLFDNWGGKHHSSRILKYDPAHDTTTVLFPATADQSLFSNMSGRSQLLPNGDLFIVESTQGKMFEVTPKGDMVWQFINPVMLKDRPTRITDGVRYSTEELTFLKEPSPHVD